MSSVLRMSAKVLIGHSLDSIGCALIPPKRMSIGKFHKVFQWIFLKWLQQTSLRFAGFQGTDSRHGNPLAKLLAINFKLRHYPEDRAPAARTPCGVLRRGGPRGRP